MRGGSWCPGIATRWMSPMDSGFRSSSSWVRCHGETNAHFHKAQTITGSRNASFRHISRDILLESLRSYGVPASHKNIANFSLSELNVTIQIFYLVKPPTLCA